jgi:hypothetical protein
MTFQRVEKYYKPEQYNSKDYNQAYKECLSLKNTKAEGITGFQKTLKNWIQKVIKQVETYPIYEIDIGGTYPVKRLVENLLRLETQPNNILPENITSAVTHCIEELSHQNIQAQSNSMRHYLKKANEELHCYSQFISGSEESIDELEKKLAELQKESLDSLESSYKSAIKEIAEEAERYAEASNDISARGIRGLCKELSEKQSAVNVAELNEKIFEFQTLKNPSLYASNKINVIKNIVTAHQKNIVTCKNLFVSTEKPLPPFPRTISVPDFIKIPEEEPTLPDSFCYNFLLVAGTACGAGGAALGAVALLALFGIISLSTTSIGLIIGAGILSVCLEGIGFYNAKQLANDVDCNSNNPQYI